MYMEEPLSEGTLINERYAVEKLLGAGASGSVYLCQDQLLGQARIALKVFHPAVSTNAAARVRIHRELLASSTIEHHNVARTYDAFWHNDLFAFTMEYAPGETLRKILNTRRSLPPSEVVWILCQILNGLSALHRHGLVHRDLTCNNIILGPHASVKITDLGLVHAPVAIEESGAPRRSQVISTFSNTSATLHGEVAGTPLYLAPEYITDGFFDVRSDIYGVGIIGYELLAGRAPFEELEPRELFIAKTTRTPPPLKEHAPSVPPPLCAAIDRAIALRPDQRFQSAAEMHSALSALLSTVAPNKSQMKDSRKLVTLAAPRRRVFTRARLFNVCAVFLILCSATMIALELLPRHYLRATGTFFDEMQELLTDRPADSYRHIGPEPKGGREPRN